MGFLGSDDEAMTMLTRSSNFSTIGGDAASRVSHGRSINRLYLPISMRPNNRRCRS